MADVALAENGDVFGARGEERFEVAVLVGGNALAAGGAERHDVGVRKAQTRDALEKLHFGGVGIGVARLDEVHAQLIERLDDLDFVVDGEGDVGALRPVAQGGIEYL